MSIRGSPQPRTWTIFETRVFNAAINVTYLQWIIRCTRIYWRVSYTRTMHLFIDVDISSAVRPKVKVANLRLCRIVVLRRIRRVARMQISRISFMGIRTSRTSRHISTISHSRWFYRKIIVLRICVWWLLLFEDNDILYTYT